MYKENWCSKISNEPKKLGAVPKVANSDSTKLISSSINFPGIPKNGNRGLVDSSEEIIEKKSAYFLKVQNIIKDIGRGHKIMVIMRGVPGSGKSYLARFIVNQSVGNDFRNYIFSTDDYFYNINDEYIYKKEKLSEAHEYNQKRVRKKAVEGWSPIIIDNTNIKIWEMFPYLQIAVQYGYIVEILQPHNKWCNSVSKLSLTNTHGVPKEKIENMLKNFEPITVGQLFKIYNLKYSMPIPQFRHYPSLETNIISTIEAKLNFENEFNLKMSDDIDSVKSKEYLTKDDLNNDLSSVIHKKVNSKSYNYVLPWPKFIKKNDAVSNNESLKEQNQTINNILDFESLNIEDSDTPKNSHIELNDNQIMKDVNRATEVYYSEAANIPKSPRNNSIIQKNYTENIESSDEIKEYNLSNMEDSDWKSYEEESNEFWNKNHENVTRTTGRNNLNVIKLDHFLSPKPKRILNKTSGATLNMLASLNYEKKVEHVDVSNEKLEKHALNCPNESKSFLMLRQIYQNKQLDGLWDLFEKCKGDVNWAIDILLKNDLCVDQQIEESELQNFFHCHCEENQNKLNLDGSDQEKENSLLEKNIRFNKTKKEKINYQLSPEMIEAKRAIEKQIVLAEEYYSENLRKLRSTRHSIEIKDRNSIDTAQDVIETINVVEDSFQESEEFDCETEMVEINLGEELIKQLEKIFNIKSSLNYSNFKTNVFMPINLAKQLYALWMESLYNQMEEQKQNAIKEDEEFAKSLQNHITNTDLPDPPKNFKEIMDMELAWSFYKSDIEKWKNSRPQNLALHLTQLKLCEFFPNIDKDILFEILNAHGNRFSDTVEVLRDSLKANQDNDIQQKGIDLLKQAKDEFDKNAGNDVQITEFKETKTQSTGKQLEADEAKKTTLRDFEESRNLAVHHCQLKGECYQKAKDAIQKGNHVVALYYSQIANLHKNKIEKYNQKAANCIIEMQSLNQNNPDVIDLHYLHVLEAIECLDVFIDKQITKLKNVYRSYKHIYIITGRGLHSTGGISTIKNKVKSRLKDRNLTWSEVNPGLLKVRIFSTSQYSEIL